MVTCVVEGGLRKKIFSLQTTEVFHLNDKLGMAERIHFYAWIAEITAPEDFS